MTAIHTETWKLLTVAEAAELLRISRSLVYQLVESGRLPAARLGRGRGAIRILHDDLLKFVELSRVEVVDPAPPRTRQRLKHLTIKPGR